jgi:hypothetical protein
MVGNCGNNSIFGKLGCTPAHVSPYSFPERTPAVCGEIVPQYLGRELRVENHVSPVVGGIEGVSRKQAGVAGSTVGIDSVPTPGA